MIEKKFYLVIDKKIYEGSFNPETMEIIGRGTLPDPFGKKLSLGKSERGGIYAYLHTGDHFERGDREETVDIPGSFENGEYVTFSREGTEKEAARQGTEYRKDMKKLHSIYSHMEQKIDTKKFSENVEPIYTLAREYIAVYEKIMDYRA